MQVKTIAIISTLSALVFFYRQKKSFRLGRITSENIFRGCDMDGCGYYLAPRGARLHQGVDISARVGEPIYSPISGTVTREARPYGGTGVRGNLNGLVISNGNTEVKMFYLRPLPYIVGQNVNQGELIGYAQNLNLIWPNMTNHIHVEIKRNGKTIEPKF